MARGRDLVDSEDEEMEYSAPSAKRTKLSDEANGNSSNSNVNGNNERTEPNMQVDEDGFVEGSIVKITLTNFVTYDYCEIFPGPQMNMIIGPNGTGKSTIVCAIALGLGGTPSLLGRAKNIAEFVKTGEEEATIAIELKKVGVRNIVIQRTFRKNDNTNTWRINGKTESQREVLNTIRKLNVQVDNLCQFLPQDRVAEFAELTPPQLLERTQAATGETELHDMQKKLMEWRNQEKSLEKAIHSSSDELKTLQTRNAELERDVMRMQQREEIMKKIKLFKAQIPLVKYSDAKKRVDDLKESASKNKVIVATVKAELAPIREAIDKCEKNLKELTTKQTEEANKAKRQLEGVKTVASKIERAREEIKRNNATIINTQKRIPEREREIEVLRVRIEKLEAEVREKPSDDVSHLEEAIAEVNVQFNEQYSNSNRIQRQIRETNSQQYEIKKELTTKEKELQEMNNILHVRMNKLRNRYPDVYEAYKFVKDNPDKFQGKVHGPVALAINVKDNRYNALVEQTLGGAKSSVLRTFVCETKEDYKTFTRVLIDGKRLKIDAAWPDRISDHDIKTPTTTEELQDKFKMDYYVSDLLVGDSHIIRYLCKDKKINLMPVALKRSHEEELVNHSPFKKFAIGETFYNVKTSDYGRKSKQTSTSFVRPAEMFSDSVDNEARSAVVEEIRNLQAKIQQADVVVKEYNAEHDKNKQTMQELKHKKEDLQVQKRDIQTMAQTYKRKLVRIEQTKAELEEALKSPEELHDQIRKLKEKVENCKADEETQMKNYIRSLTNYVESYETRNIYKLQGVHANGKLASINNYMRTQNSRLVEAEKNLADAKKQYQLAQREAQIYKRECENAGESLEDELRTQFQEILNRFKDGNMETTEELEDKIREEEGKLAGIRFANPNAMKHYEERKVEIARKEQKVEEAKNEVEVLKTKIAELRDVWEPRIDNLVRRISVQFSEAFARINCAGEVDVDKHEDFDKWGINIRVKFRQTEKLQLLTGQRQSGGERSVTTVLYLMSLQNLAKSPFRVVDEINQGMDPRNERMIHEQIVQGATAPGTSQYFLITPKLLPDLFYNEHMRVLCIYNSEWLPSKIKPLTHYLEHAQATGYAA